MLPTKTLTFTILREMNLWHVLPRKKDRALVTLSVWVSLIPLENFILGRSNTHSGTSVINQEKRIKDGG
jgi:hypothetical protein